MIGSACLITHAMKLTASTRSTRRVEQVLGLDDVTRTQVGTCSDYTWSTWGTGGAAGIKQDLHYIIIIHLVNEIKYDNWPGW